MNKSKKNIGIQQLRAVSMLIVVIQHFIEHFLSLANIGPFYNMSHSAVYIFFSISGFVMMKVIDENFNKSSEGFLLTANEHNIKVYLVRRVFRILPIAVIGLLSLLLMNNIVQGSSYKDLFVLILLFLTATSDLYLSINLLFNNFYFSTFGFWSLAGEEKLYFLLPFICTIAKKIKNIQIVFISMIAISILFIIIVLKYLPQNSYMGIYFSPLNFCRDFFSGSIVYLLSKKYNIKKPSNLLGTFLNVCVFLFILILHAPLFSSSIPIILLSHCVLTFFSCFLIFRAYCGSNLTNNKYCSLFLNFFADRSYTIYILHLPIMFSAFKVLNNYPISQMLKIFIVTFFIAFLTDLIYRYVEFPLIAYSRKRFHYNRN